MKPVVSFQEQSSFALKLAQHVKKQELKLKKTVIRTSYNKHLKHRIKLFSSVKKSLMTKRGVGKGLIGTLQCTVSFQEQSSFALKLAQHVKKQELKLKKTVIRTSYNKHLKHRIKLFSSVKKSLMTKRGVGKGLIGTLQCTKRTLLYINIH